MPVPYLIGFRIEHSTIEFSFSSSSRSIIFMFSALPSPLIWIIASLFVFINPSHKFMGMEDLIDSRTFVIARFPLVLLKSIWFPSSSLQIFFLIHPKILSIGTKCSQYGGSKFSSIFKNFAADFVFSVVCTAALSSTPMIGKSTFWKTSSRSYLVSTNRE